MLTNGFISVSRKMVMLDVFSDNEKFAVLMKLLFKVRFRETEENGVKVGVNQFLCSVTELAREFQMDVKKLRSCLRHFERKGYITTENIQNRCTLVTLSEELCEFMGEEKAVERKRHAAKKVTKGEEEKHIPEEKAEISEAESSEEYECYGVFHNVRLTREQYKSFSEKSEKSRVYIDKLSAYLENHPEKKYKSHYALLVSELYEKELSERGAREKEPTKTQNTTEKRTGYFGFSQGEASYDIKRAEEWARTHVPKVKKRSETGKLYTINPI